MTTPATIMVVVMIMVIHMDMIMIMEIIHIMKIQMRIIIHTITETIHMIIKTTITERIHMIINTISTNMETKNMEITNMIIKRNIITTMKSTPMNPVKNVAIITLKNRRNLYLINILFPLQNVITIQN
jgi:hypothetical protein